MANKQIQHSYEGMLQDITKSKFSNKFYFEGRNIRILSTDSQSTGSITNEKGNKLILTIPKPTIDLVNTKIKYNNKELSFTTNELDGIGASGEQLIISQCSTRDYIILFTTDNNGFDCIWKVKYEDYDISLVYLRNMDFSINNPIQCLNNYENKNVDKIYWIDGKSQLKFLNLNHSIVNEDLEELIDINLNSIESTSSYNLSQPNIVKILKGGNHTAGMIQYCYNLYKLNSSESKISPITPLISLDKDILGGGNVNEIVSSMPVVNIDNIDDNFTHIKVYSIKYNSYNETPIISIIKDQLIPTNYSLEVFDDGKVIQTISLEQFIFLGSDILIPKNMESKFNRLFLANYREVNFKINLDCRAYSFNSSGIAKIYHNIFLNSSNIIDGDSFNINGSNYDDLTIKKYDSINLDYDNNKFQQNGVTYGGEGKYLKYELTQDSNVTSENKFFKDEEIYRCGIVFYNKYGQKSNPRWIADFKSRSGNLNNLFNTFKITLKPEFYNWLNNSINFNSKYDKPVGYKILIAQRNLEDRTIISNGILSPCMVTVESQVRYPQLVEPGYVRDVTKRNSKIPNILLRNCGGPYNEGNNTYPLAHCLHNGRMDNTKNSWQTELQQAYSASRDTYKQGYQFNSMLQLYSPETLFDFNQNFQSDLKLKIKGVIKNKENSAWAKNWLINENRVTDESKCFGGITPSRSSSIQGIVGDPYSPMSWGLISYPSGSMREEDRHCNHMHFYRNYTNNQSIYTNSNSIKELKNDLIDLNSNDSSNERILTINNLRGVQFKTTNVYDLINLTYDFTPNAGFLTIPYSVKVYSDDQGTNLINELPLGIGIRNLNIIETYLGGATQDYNYFFEITTSSNIEINVDIDCILGNSSIPNTYHKESLLNLYVISTIGISNSLFVKSNSNTLYDIYGTPELTERGQDYKSYNNDANYRYTNSLESVGTGGNTKYQHNGDHGRRIASINSYNNRCVTLVTGPNDKLVEHWERPSLENLYSETLIPEANVALIGELVKSNESIYLGNIYGGNSYESKLRTNYLEVGDYKQISESINYVKSPGDTFVNNFRFERISKTEKDILNDATTQYCEIVDFLTESTIDLKNRNDYSLDKWDNVFQPINTKYHNYNKVYSQSNNLLTNRDLNYNFKSVNSFDTNVISSKLKSPGEIIDGWTDFLPNEVLTLNGKYGSINSIVNFNDELYTIQDKAFAFLSINPRIQIQGSDGIGVQLGTGNVLDRYQYISNTYGTMNKWSVITTPTSIYFFDILNKSFNIFKGSVGKLSDSQNMHHYFINNINYDELKIDNPLIKQGISSSYDYINDDVFMTFHQTNNNYNISFNERTNNFVSFYDYNPSIYVSKGDHFITTSPDLKSIYKQYSGNYNEFYGVKYPSYVVLNVNPESDKDCVFDNINFKSDVTLDNIDQIDKTITHLQAYNDYQDSNLIPLTVGRNNNLRRKFRNWSALIPRQGRNRIRAPYVKLKLNFDNQSNYKMILHDVAVFYTTN